MFAVKRNAVIGFNLYCGGGSPGLVPASPAGEQTPPPAAAAPAAAAATVAEVPRPLIGSAGLWAAAGRAEAPRAPIGSGAAPHAPIGSAAARRAPPDSTSRPVALWSPEEELDGCEPESERGPGGDSLPGTPPELPDLIPDELRQESLELILRYLREAAGEAEPGVKKLFPGLLGGPGRPCRASSAVMEKALETLRRVGDGVMQKHELAFQGAWNRETAAGVGGGSGRGVKTKADFVLGRGGGGLGCATPRPGAEGRPCWGCCGRCGAPPAAEGALGSPPCSLEWFWGSLMRCGGAGAPPGAVLGGSAAALTPGRGFGAAPRCGVRGFGAPRCSGRGVGFPRCHTKELWGSLVVLYGGVGGMRVVWGLPAEPKGSEFP